MRMQPHPAKHAGRHQLFTPRTPSPITWAISPEEGQLLAWFCSSKGRYGIQHHWGACRKKMCCTSSKKKLPVSIHWAAAHPGEGASGPFALVVFIFFI
jgi:hypothetical protein